MRRRGTVRASLTAVITLGGLTVVCAAACVQRPVVVTEPVAVRVDSAHAGKSPVRALPTKGARAYPDFWHAVNDVDFPAASELAENDDQRALVTALAEMRDGRSAMAEQVAQTLLDARDTIVQRAARITYSALLSERADWSGLAEFARRSREVGFPADEAGVGAWASAFVQTHTESSFVDSVVTLPLFRTTSGAPVIEVRINGVRKHFWLDTGSSLTILASSVAEECHVSAVGSDTLEFLTAAGRLPARPAIVVSLRVGGLQITNAPAMIVERAALTLRTGKLLEEGGEISIDGIIGFDVIRQLDLTIDDPGKRVVIRRPVLLSDDPRHPRNLMWFGLPIVTAVSDRGTVLHLALDTGAEETYATASFIQKTHAHVVSAERRIVHGFGGSNPQQGFVIPNAHVTIGNTLLLIQHMFVYEAQYPTIFNLDGTLGPDAWRGMIVHIDILNGRIAIEP